MQTRKGLGKGLESLLPPAAVKAQVPAHALNTLPIESIVPNRLQPRTVFDDEKIKELSNSIREDGVLQPLIVSPTSDGRYELIAGERRLRASRIAGLTEVPVVIKTADATSMLVLSLIENIQREDLNPIEESLAYKELIDQFGLTQDEVAKRVGKSRTTVANSLRLLNLPQVIKEDVSAGRYSAGHARALLSTESIRDQLKLREWIVRTTPTVRSVEKKVTSIKNGTSSNNQKEDIPSQVSFIIDRMKESLGTKVSLVRKRKGGKLVIDYYSWQDLDRIYRRILGS